MENMNFAVETGEMFAIFRCHLSNAILNWSQERTMGILKHRLGKLNLNEDQNVLMQETVE